MLTITRYGNRFDVDTGDNRLHVLNWKSLEYHLKSVLGMTKKEIKLVTHSLLTNTTVKIERVAV